VPRRIGEGGKHRGVERIASPVLVFPVVLVHEAIIAQFRNFATDPKSVRIRVRRPRRG
jgi:hypothetical protein